MSTTRLSLAVLATLLSSSFAYGCDETAEPSGHEEARADAPGEADVLPAGAHSFETSRFDESAVRLLLERSPVAPWCSGVLVAPDVVVTATHCVEGRGGHELTVASSAGAQLRVDGVEPLDRDPRLTALVLETPARGVAPADVVEPTRERCDVTSVSYLFVPVGEPVESWTWSGCYSPDTETVEVVDGSPNCHGDTGAPAYAGDEGIVGIAVGAASLRGALRRRRDPRRGRERSLRRSDVAVPPSRLIRGGGACILSGCAQPISCSPGPSR